MSRLFELEFFEVRCRRGCVDKCGTQFGTQKGAERAVEAVDAVRNSLRKFSAC